MTALLGAINLSGDKSVQRRTRGRANAKCNQSLETLNATRNTRLPVFFKSTDKAFRAAKFLCRERNAFFKTSGGEISSRRCSRGETCSAFTGEEAGAKAKEESLQLISEPRGVISIQKQFETIISGFLSFFLKNENSTAEGSRCGNLRPPPHIRHAAAKSQAASRQVAPKVFFPSHNPVLCIQLRRSSS